MPSANETPAPEDGDSRPLKLRILRAVPVVVILGLLIHLLLPRLGTIEASLETLRTMKPWALLISVAMECLSYVANGALLQSIVQLHGDRMPLRRAVAIEAGASTVALVAAGPVGFGAAVYRWTSEGGVSAEVAALASWLPSVFDAGSLVVFALISGVELLHYNRLSRLTVTALAIVVSALTIVIVLAIVLLARNDWMKAMAKRAGRLVKHVRPRWDESGLIRGAAEAAATGRRLRHGVWLRPVGCSLMVVVFDLLCLRYAFLAAGQVVSLSFLLAGYGVPILLGRASFIPGGVAVTEVAMAAIFGGLGVPANVAVVSVLTYRLFSFWLPSLIGIPIATTLQSQGKTKP